MEILVKLRNAEYNLRGLATRASARLLASARV